MNGIPSGSWSCRILCCPRPQRHERLEAERIPPCDDESTIACPDRGDLQSSHHYRPRDSAEQHAGAGTLQAQRRPRSTPDSRRGVGPVARFRTDRAVFRAAKPDGVVTTAVLRVFDAQVTPRFPDGLTVVKGDGQFRGEIRRSSRRLLRLILLTQSRASGREQNHAIRRLYKDHFDQSPCSASTTRSPCASHSSPRRGTLGSRSSTDRSRCETRHLLRLEERRVSVKTTTTSRRGYGRYSLGWDFCGPCWAIPVRLRRGCIDTPEGASARCSNRSSTGVVSTQSRRTSAWCPSAKQRHLGHR